ncbi:dephospho-CoA kinase [Patescibacteria group bacterium]|nr:dephospho-CoA kinase [Patescibacteria group bacterium]
MSEAPEPGYEAVRQQLCNEFGEEIRSADGFINRKVLGRIIFADPVKRKKLDDIIATPFLVKVRKEMMGKKGIILLNGALLVESGLNRLANNNIVLLDTDSETQKERLGGRGHSAEEIEQRIASQLSSREKKTILVDDIEKT